jgi:hypothetical protein
MNELMKKIFLISAILPALLLVSCNKEVKETPEAPQEVTARFLALAPETKTVLGEKNSTSNTYPVLWSTNDTKVAYVLTTSADLKTADLVPAADGKSAEITAKLTAASSYQFVFTSPQVALKSANASNQSILLEIPAAQVSTPAGPDEAAQILYAVTDEIKSLDSEIPVTFSHATAYLHLFFTNVTLPAGATVQSVTVEAPEGCFISGRNHFLPATGVFNGSGSSQFNLVTVNTATTDEVWCGIVPANLGGKVLKLIINTDKGTLSKSITLPSSAVLACGDVAKLTVSMAGITAQESVEYQLVSSESSLHWGDKIIIAAADYDVAISNGQNTNNRSQAGITKSNNGTTILDPSSSVEVFQLEDGIKPGTYALKATVQPGYVYAAAGYDDAGNYLRTKDKLDDCGSWEITFGDITPGDQEAPDAERAIIKAIVPHKNLIRYNATSSLFSSYATTTSQLPVKIYRLKGEPDNSPRFRVNNEAGTLEAVKVSADGGTVPVYVLGNVAWTASVSGTGATLDVTSGTGAKALTLTVPANTGEARSFTVTVSTSASVPATTFNLTVNQSAPVNTSGDPQLVYSIVPNREANSNYGSNGTYAGSCDMTINGIVWNATGVTSSSDYDGWRLGGKSITNVVRPIYSKTALPANVTKVVVTHTNFNITVNSFTLTVHSSASDASTGKNPIATLTGTVSKTEPTTFEKEDSTSWAGCYYRLAYNVTNTGSSNKYVQLQKIEIWGYPAD